MKDLDGAGAGQRGGHARRPTDVLGIHEDPNVPTELPRFVPELEPETRVALLELVKEMLNRIGLDPFLSSGTELPEPAVQAHIDRDGLWSVRPRGGFHAPRGAALRTMDTAEGPWNVIPPRDLAGRR